MKFWAADEALNCVRVPSEVAELVDITLEVVSISGNERTRLVRIGQYDGGHGDERFQVDLELAPGIIFPTILESGEGTDDGWDDPAESKDHRASLLQEGLSACMPILNEIADALHDTRMRARRAVAAWNASAIPTRLIEVRLAPYDYWRGSHDPALCVTVETLDDGLVPVGLDVIVENREKLEAELDKWRDHVSAAYVRRAVVASKGATGTIDQLALNVLAHFGDLTEGVRRLANEQRFWFPDQTAIITLNGHVFAGNAAINNHLHLNGDDIVVHSTYVAADQLRQAVGRPASLLIDCEFLSDDITVVDAACAIADGLPVLTIKTNNPTRLFCSVSGRVWDDVEDISARDRDRNSDGKASGLVVPFRGR